MSRILIVYASHYGQTRKIAQRLASHLRDHGHGVEVADARTDTGALPPPKNFDLVMLGSRVEGGHHAKEIRSYITEHRAALRAMPTAFFSVSNAAHGPDNGGDPRGYLGKLFGEQRWTPTHSAALAGGLPYRKYGWLTRFIMKSISRSAGHPTDTSRDHELTDWEAVRRFADEVARRTPQAVATSRR